MQNNKKNEIVPIIIFSLTILSLFLCCCGVPLFSISLGENFLGYFVVMELTLFFFLLLLFFVAIYSIEKSKKNKSFPIKAVVIEYLGEKELSTGRSKSGKERYNRTPIYKVGFKINNEYFEKEAIVKRYNIKQGMVIDIQCYYNDENELEIFSEAEISWALQMIFIYSIIIIASLLIMIFV